MGSKVDLSAEKLSGVLAPSDLRLRYPEGVPAPLQEVDVRAEKPERGKKYTLEELNPTIPAPKIKNDHIWGVREDWGEKKSGSEETYGKSWGKGASAYEGEEKKKL